MARANTRVSGHYLINEGAPHDRFGYPLPRTAPQGCAKCSCGLVSDWLPTFAARKRWSKAHKADIVAKQLSGKGNMDG